MRKMLSRKYVLKEYRRAKRYVKLLDGANRDAMYGTMQALAWVLRDHAAAPVDCFIDRKRRVS